MKRNRLFALLLTGILSLSLLAACGTKDDAKEIDIPALWTTITEKVELPDLMELDDTTLKDIYGIDPADLESYTARIPFMNVQATEFFIAKVKEGQLDAVKEAISKRQAALDEQWSQYLPDQYELVKNYKLETVGNYVLFCVCAKADDVVKLFTDAAK